MAELSGKFEIKGEYVADFVAAMDRLYTREKYENDTDFLGRIIKEFTTDIYRRYFEALENDKEQAVRNRVLSEEVIVPSDLIK